MSLLLVLALSLVAPPPAPLPAPALAHKLAGHTGTVRGAAFSPDGRSLATVGDDGRLIVWGLGTGKTVLSVRMPAGAGSVEFSRDGTLLLTAGTDRVVRLWDARTGKETRAFAGHTGALYVACFTPDNRQIASTGIDNLTRLWDVATGKEVRSMPSGTCYALAVSPDGKSIVTGGAGKDLVVWETATGKEVRRMPGHTDVIVWLAFSPDGRTIASASYDRTVRLWEASSGKERLRITCGNSPRVLMFSTDGRYLAEGNYDGGARLYDSGSGKELFADRSIAQSLYAVALSGDRWYLCGGGTGNKLQVWDVSALTRTPVPAGEMAPATFAEHWKALGSNDAGEAYRAMAALAVPGAAKQLAERFRPPRPLDAAALKRTPQLLRDLESDDDDRWRKAADELAGFGPAILPRLKAALEKADDPDVKLRLIVTIRRADIAGADELRALRLVEALERLRSPEAIHLLEMLARGERGKAAAGEARATLARLRARRRFPRRADGAHPAGLLPSRNSPTDDSAR